ncbi:MAG: AuaD protein [Brevibacillus sp.]|nr:AuaD protein [Brevibacillus sp.]
MSMKGDSIVITGIGAVSPYGVGTEALLKALRTGEMQRCTTNGEAASDKDSCELYVMKVGAWNPAELLGKRGLQYLRPSTQYLFAASLLALQHAGLDDPKPDPDDIGIVVGSNLAGLQSITQYDLTAVTEGPQYVSPMEAPNTLANAPASHLAIRVQARAFNTTVASGQCAGFDALGYASKMLREKRTRYVIVGGVEELNPRVMWVYRHADVLPAERPEDAGLPYHPESTGWIPSEGAAVLILEQKADALARGVRPLAELAAWTSTFALSKETGKRSAALERAAWQVLTAAGRTPDELDLIVSGANGLSSQDQAEALAFSRLLADRPAVPVLPVKETLGESYGAGGIFQTLAAIGVLQNEEIPPSYRLVSDTASLVPNREATPWINHQTASVLLTSQDLFGASSAVVLTRCGE